MHTKDHMGKFALVLLGAFLFGGAAFSAQWTDKSGKTIPDQEGMKSAANFIAQIILTTDEQSLLKKWSTPSETVNVSTASTVERNKPISAFIVFGGCKVDQRENCNLVVKFKIFQTDGKVYADLPEMEVWSGKPVPPNRSIQLSVAYLKVVIENGEQLGTYKVVAEVADKNAKESVSLFTAFNAVEKR
jgi:hypothetical protein